MVAEGTEVNPMQKVVCVVVGALTGAVLVMIATTPSSIPLVSSAIAAVSPHSGETYQDLALFGKVFDIVRQDYVVKPDDTKLTQSAINGMMSALDPHSNYMDAKEYKDMQVETSGKFAGLGMEITLEGGVIKVVSPIDGTPAAKAGILAGDVISAIDGKATAGLPLDEVVAKLRGPVGSKVTLAITRHSKPTPFNVTLTREIIKERPVTYRAEGDNVGYIRISEFNGLVSDELKTAIQKLSKTIPADQLKGYILDLRNNPGGLLDQAVAVCDDFLKQGEIVSTRGRDPDENERFDAKSGGDLIHGKPLIVLINGGSASASEIVAGALQDQKRATIVGSRSFGKGSVQTIIPLGSDNGALRLTTARYFTPSGRTIQAQGIKPDIQVLEQVPKDLQSHEPAISEASLPGHFKAQGQEYKGSQSYVPADPKDDKALQTALALMRGTEINAAFPPSQNEALAHTMH